MTDETSRRDLEARLQAVTDRQDIHDALMRYCHGVDRNDVALILSAFHPGATDKHDDAEERAEERFPRTAGEGAALMKWLHHTVTNILIQLDGDVANSQCYVTARHRIACQGREIDWTLGARYLDRFERRNGEWRIARRTLICDWERFDDVAPKPTGIPAAAFFDNATQGARSREDYSYTMLRF
jgi:hypothetical protein